MNLQRAAEAALRLGMIPVLAVARAQRGQRVRRIPTCSGPKLFSASCVARSNPFIASTGRPLFSRAVPSLRDEEANRL